MHAESIVHSSAVQHLPNSALMSTLVMLSCYAPREFGAILRDMGETGGDIAQNSGPDTGSPLASEEYIRVNFDGMLLRIDHLDTGLHELQQQAARIEKHLEAITAELDQAAPLIDAWKRSKLRKLAAGQMPWAQ
jgi:hypothetical protein